MTKVNLSLGKRRGTRIDQTHKSVYRSNKRERKEVCDGGGLNQQV